MGRDRVAARVDFHVDRIYAHAGYNTATPTSVVRLAGGVFDGVRSVPGPRTFHVVSGRRWNLVVGLGGTLVQIVSSTSQSIAAWYIAHGCPPWFATPAHEPLAQAIALPLAAVRRYRDQEERSDEEIAAIMHVPISVVEARCRSLHVCPGLATVRTAITQAELLHDTATFYSSLSAK